MCSLIFYAAIAGEHEKVWGNHIIYAVIANPYSSSWLFIEAQGFRKHQVMGLTRQIAINRAHFH